MNSEPRRARFKALAKINLSLRVLQRRPGGYHEIRTIFQTISLADSIEAEFEPARRTSVELNSDPPIPDNLMQRAAGLALDCARATGRVRLRLRKRIPIGGGLGGGSSDAAAVLLGLPVLAGGRPTLPALRDAAAQLGSDVPFFLLGGTALGVGRGEELYPLPEMRPASGLLVFPGAGVPTADAYRWLGRPLTMTPESPKMNSFQALAWSLGTEPAIPAWAELGENDFEPVVFQRYPRLKWLQRKLVRLGARPAMMSGSGSSLFGIFAAPGDLDKARGSWGQEATAPFRLVGRKAYRSMWWRSLRDHMDGRQWPPQSRYAK